jgi:Uma2 family endonuclease
MGLPATKTRMTVEQYFEFQENSEEKHEFDEGEVLAMSGGTPPHAQVAQNFLSAIWMRMRGKPCQPYGSDLRVRAGKSVRYVYPDGVVVCGPLEYDALDPRRKTILNPLLIAEVLSKSTEGYDRGEKFARYREIESLQEYFLIDQTRPRVEAFLRRESNWTFTPVNGMDKSVPIASLGIEIPMSEIYERVVFSAEDNGAD